MAIARGEPPGYTTAAPSTGLGGRRRRARFSGRGVVALAFTPGRVDATSSIRRAIARGEPAGLRATSPCQRG
ncbi:MAG: hypothetical protein R3A10_00500 [Caldilineaceae bacterium]